MAKQLTAPGCIYTIVARVDTTIYSPDQNWVLDVPAGQHDFIAETNEVIIPADAMMRRKTRQHAKDRNRINLLGIGPGSLVSFITRAIERIVGKGNVEVTYGDGKLTVVLAASATLAQIAMVESLLERMLPKDVTEEIDETPIGYTRLYFLEMLGTQYIDTGITEYFSLTQTISAVDGQRSIVGYVRGTGIAMNYWGVFDTGQVYLGEYSAINVYAHEPTSITYELTREFLNFGQTGYLRKIVVTASKPSQLTIGYSRTSGYFRLYSARISVNSVLVRSLIPTLDPAGKPCMFDLITRESFYNKGTGQFIAGMTTDQALNLENLPITGDGALTVSLPWEDQWDAGVQNALDTASTNGWTITVQYRDPDVGTENIPISFLESTGTQYIDTGIKLSNESAVQCKFEEFDANDGYVALYGSRNTYLQDGYIWNISTPQDAIGQIEYGNSVVVRYRTEQGIVLLTKNKEQNYQNNIQLSANVANTFESPISCFLYATNMAARPSYHAKGRVYAFSIARNNRSQLNFIPALDRTGRPCMFDAVTGKLFYNAATTGPDFIAGMTWEQVRKLQLPTTGGQLTLSLPYEASLDGIAQDALERARANGWVLTLQYDEAEVPAGYSKVDFLESTGNQWIDTGVNLSSESTIECAAALVNDSTSSIAVCGTYTASDKYGLFWHLTKLASGGDSQIGQYQGSIWFTSPTVAEIGKVYRFKQTRGELWIDGELAPTLAVNDFSLDLSAALFCTKTADTNFYYRSASRIYSFSINRNSALQLAYVPCLDPEGVPCMYDLVSQQAFRNGGTGQFIAGMTLEQVRSLNLPAGGGQLTLSLPFEASIDKQAQTTLEQARENGWELTLQYAESDVPAGYRKLDFLESTGTQYIDTGVNLSSESEVQCEFERTAYDTGSQAVFGVYAPEPRYALLCNLAGDSYLRLATQSGYIFAKKIQNGEQIKFSKKNTNVYIDDELVGTFAEQNETSVSCRIFSAAPAYYANARIHSFTISRAGETQVDYVPCISPDGKLGMYNKVDGTLQENAGTGSFIAGLATIDAVSNLWLPETGGELTISVPADTPDSAVDQLRTNNPTWQIAIQYRTDNEN